MSMRLMTGGKSNAFSVAGRFAEDTQKALAAARNEAEARGASSVTVSDLLAGLSVEENTRAGRVGSLKANAFYLRWLTNLPPLPRAVSLAKASEPELELNSEAHKALAFAVTEADRDREYWIDSDHLLRALMRFPNNADFALLKTELSLDSVRAGSRRDREEFLPEQNPSLKVVRYLVRKHFSLWVSPIVSLACYLYILIQTIGIGAGPLSR